MLDASIQIELFSYRSSLFLSRKISRNAENRNRNRPDPATPPGSLSGVAGSEGFGTRRLIRFHPLNRQQAVDPANAHQRGFREAGKPPLPDFFPGAESQKTQGHARQGNPAAEIDP